MTAASSPEEESRGSPQCVGRRFHSKGREVRCQIRADKRSWSAKNCSFLRLDSRLKPVTSRALYHSLHKIKLMLCVSKKQWPKGRQVEKQRASCDPRKQNWQERKQAEANLRTRSGRPGANLDQGTDKDNYKPINTVNLNKCDVLTIGQLLKPKSSGRRRPWAEPGPSGGINAQRRGQQSLFF